jgi:hypothetical protein
MKPHGYRSACFANVTSATFIGCAIDALCCLLWISFWSGLHEQAPTSVFSSEYRANVMSIPYMFELLWNTLQIHTAKRVSFLFRQLLPLELMTESMKPWG